MKTKTVFAALALSAAAVTGTVASAQGWSSDRTWDSTAFWRGAPDGLQQRIDWLQQRIDRGVSDGSLSREEARRAQWQLNTLRRDADTMQRRLDDLSRSIRWARRDGDYRYGGYSSGYLRDRDRYVTDYDASRYYRDDSRYVERRLGNDDYVYRGSDGRYYCRRSDGTTGLIIGGIGGAALGNVIDGGRDRVAGTLIGGALGALVGKSVDQNSDVRCR